MVRKKVIAVGGYFDPLHVGHLDLFKRARRLGKLVVVVNNKTQTVRKKGFEFMTHKERMEIVRSLRNVDEVIPSIDKGKSINKTLAKLMPDILGNGGDRKNEEIPEAETCKRLGIKIVDGLGKKIQSSSGLIKKKKDFEKKKKKR